MPLTEVIVKGNQIFRCQRQGEMAKAEKQCQHSLCKYCDLCMSNPTLVDLDYCWQFRGVLCTYTIYIMDLFWTYEMM